ncbi:MAG TPA: phosphatase PAP2 family protein [Limnochordia bacterium]|nr:phosphatase PAP2 family protein [Limnochordia bacterium]
MQRLVERHPWLKTASEALEDIGGPYGIAAATGALWLADHQAGKKALQAVILTAAGTYLVKAVTQRERPVARTTKTAPGVALRDSFPSGHSALAFAVAKVAAESFPEVREAAYAAAALVGLSRVALGRHWMSDVVAGAWLGYWIASATLDNPVPFWVWEW